MNESDIANIKNSWKYIVDDGLDHMMNFYTKLFVKAPDARIYFNGDMTAQAEKLAYTVSFVVTNIDRLDTIKESVEDLGRMHNKLNIAERYYPLVRDSLIETIQDAMGARYKPEIGASWFTALNTLAEMMLNAPEKKSNKFKSLLNKIFIKKSA